MHRLIQAALAALLVATVAAPAAAQTSVTQADIQRLQDNVFQAGTDITQLRSRDAVREILESSGASVHYLDHELQRIHRDVHMIAAHTVFDVDLVAEGVGRELVQQLEKQHPPEEEP